MKVSIDRLRAALSYDPDTGEFKRLVGVRGHAAGEAAGCRNNLGYVQIRIDGRLYGAHRLAWLYVYGAWPSGLIDHIDRVRHNNAIKNLREVTVQENAQNSVAHADAVSRFKGVSLHAAGRWRADIRVGGRRRFLGLFDTEREAALAYQGAASEMQTHGAAQHV